LKYHVRLSLLLKKLLLLPLHLLLKVLPPEVPLLPLLLVVKLKKLKPLRRKKGRSELVVSSE
jgi:hypothetical protein